MMRYFKYVSPLLAISLFVACTNTSGNPAVSDNKGFFGSVFADAGKECEQMKPIDYLAYCENTANGLKLTREMGDFVFSAFYQPISYLALNELKPLDTLTRTALESKVKEYGDMDYFSFKIQNTKSQGELLKIALRSESDYYARLEYLSFKMQQDFKLINGKDTLNCAMYHFERIYGLAPYATFVLAFPKINPKESLTFCFHDQLFNNGIIQLNFEQQQINNLPSLDI